MSDIADTDLVFDGVNGLTSDTFIRTIRRRVLAERIHQDDELVAHTAASCFEGPALDWYEGQTSETQESWKLLRRAILVRWPSSTAAPVTIPTSASTSTNIPTPAAAPLNQTAAFPDFQSPLGRIAPHLGSKSGRIRVQSEEGRIFGYVSTILNKEGHCQVTSNTSKIAIVKLTARGILHDMHIITDGREVVRLGMRWIRPKSSESLIDEILTGGVLVKVFGEGPQQRQSSTVYSGPWSPHIWSISIDGKLSVSWEIKPHVKATLLNSKTEEH